MCLYVNKQLILMYMLHIERNKDAFFKVLNDS